MTPDNQLNLRSQHPDFQSFLDINESESARLRTSYKCHLDLKYGEAPLQSLDVFPSEVPDSPILIFIHGGYWRALDKSSYSFVAEPFIKNNITTCVINYRLIPAVNMEGLIRDVLACVRWIQEKAHHYNGDARRILLCGHSAGGHLALMTCLMDKALRPDILSVCSLSGIFNLAPIRDSYLNEVLQLSKKDVESYSISDKDLEDLECPVLLTVGSGETDFFIEQSRALHEKAGMASVEFYEYPELNHYQIVHKLGQAGNPISDYLLAKI